MKKKSLFYQTPIRFAACSLLAAACFLGCPSGVFAADPVSVTDIKLDTVVTVTIYDSADESLLEGALALCDEYEQIFSRTDENSELYKLNNRLLSSVPGKENVYEVSAPLAEVLEKGLSYYDVTDGGFDIAIAPLTSLWDFHSEEHVVPDASRIEAAVEAVQAELPRIDGRLVTLPSGKTQFDLGGIAKGYIADRIRDYLLENGVQKALINLGGNVLCIGTKPDGSDFKVGVKEPFTEDSYLFVLLISDRSVVTSGVYERYFEQDGKLYHHILDPRTGYPYDNGLLSVTIISDFSVDGDALSTSCFALGLEEGLAYLDSLDNVYGIFIDDSCEIHYSEGAEAFVKK